MKRRASRVAWVRFWSSPIIFRLRLCRPSRPTKAKATMVIATITSTRVKPPAPAVRSARGAKVDVSRRDMRASGERVGDVERVEFLAVLQVDGGRLDEAVGEEVRQGDALVQLA